MADQPRQLTAPPHAAAHLLQYHDLIESIVSALDARDTYTASHSNRVADMVLVLAAALGLDPDETALIHIAAHLHDIGKIAVPDAVLRKTGPLTADEWQEMRRHPVTGYNILRRVADFQDIALFAIKYLKVHYPESLQERYKLEELSEDNVEIFDQIGHKRGFKMSGGYIDYDKVAETLLRELRSGLLGRLSFERPVGEIETV